MRRLQVLISLGVLSLAATAQAAETSVQVPGYRIELPAKAHHMFPEDFEVYKGSYELSNGESMTLTSFGSHMYAKIGKRPRTEMIAASGNQFVAVDRQFKMTLWEKQDDGTVGGEVLLLVPTDASRRANSATG